MQFWGSGNIGNEDLDFGEQGSKAIFFSGEQENRQTLQRRQTYKISPSLLKQSRDG